ncbi:arginine--tRNA ligase [Kiloniella sp. b19]|uniref:arginine--tRNA ligase n=1 Tax=Kiloniella sp. GXU_MW_B19 TaxID=3141326 RepID=UPI0031D3E09B
MNIFKALRATILEDLNSLVAEGKLADGLDFSRINAEPPRDASHGDIATNAAMVIAKAAGQKPRDLAGLLAGKLEQRSEIRTVEIAGPGFINLRLDTAFWYQQLSLILESREAYGESDLGAGRTINLEYVSANPTGPLTVGHARGAVIGDALAAILKKTGFAVTKEYYINDAGAQVDVLANSAYLRYREALGEDIGEIPSGLYPGDYLVKVGQDLAARDGDRWMKAEQDEWLPVVRTFAIDAMMDLIRADLGELGVEMDLFSSERALHEAGGVDEVFKFLEERDLLYVGVLEPPKGKAPEDWEPRPQTLFKATLFGDDVDRPLKKSDGSWTYFAGDMAYHLDKYRRGFKDMIDVFGVDHGGYVKRMKAAVKALTDNEGELDVKLCALVNLMRGGEMVRMSKRAGNFVTLRDMTDEVGKDVIRFMMLTRKNDMPLDFDLEKVLEQSRDNPVFYVQYAHARTCSVLKHAREECADLDLSDDGLKAADLTLLKDEGEIALIRQLAEWPRLLEGAAEAHEPHRIAFYLYDLAAALHGLWTKGKDNAQLRFILPDQPELTQARMALVRATGLVIASGLSAYSITPAQEMR